MTPFLKTGFWAGLTPCAFATIVFFVFMAAYIPFSKKEMNFAGGAFIAAEFLTYYFLELGTFETFRQMEIFEILVRGFYLALGIAAIILGSLCMYDWYLLKGHHGAREMVLKFSVPVDNPGKTPLNYWIKIFILAGIGGFLMALMSSHCRGYLPLSSILSLVIDSQIRLKTVVYNSLYNIMSVLPLMTVFYFISSGIFRKIVRGNGSTARVMGSGVLLGLGGGLLYMFSR